MRVTILLIIKLNREKEKKKKQQIALISTRVVSKFTH
jgi:hypothetical protein